MAKLGSNSFNIGATDIDGYTGASDFNTDGIDLTDYQEGWIVYIESTHTTGTPTISIQVSRDNTTFINYLTEAVDVSIPITIEQSTFKPNFMRIAYTANSSDGNVTFKLNKINE